jgi:hypothetical protein
VSSQGVEISNRRPGHLKLTVLSNLAMDPEHASSLRFR